ncbi:MAG: HEAT repeat domain-containing protein [Nitrospirota bacterium]
MVESAREVMRALVKAVKASKMYLPEHEICRKFRDDFAGRLLRHLEEHGDLALTVKGYEFCVGGTPVYEEANRFENLAFRCSSDGLAELVIHAGLTREDLDRLLDVLTSDSRPLDSDIVTRLWEQPIPHVTYDVAEVDEASEGEVALSSQAKRPGGGAASEAADDGAPDAAAPDPEPEAVPESLRHDSVVFALTDQDIASLQRQVVEDTTQDYVGQLIDILTSILALDDDEESFLEVLQVLDDIVATSVKQDRFERANDIVCRLAALRDDEAKVSARSRELIRVVWTQMGTWERVAPLEDSLSRQGVWETDAVARYLTRLPSSAVDSLITLLDHVQTAKGRRIICDALIAFGREGVDAMLARLPDAPWYVARNVIYVLGCVKDPRAQPGLEAVMTHPDARLRREAIKALEALGAERLGGALVSWLEDKDEAVRLHVLRLARRHASQDLLARLIAVIDDHGFSHRKETEQREWFDALADVGGDAALSLIRPWLEMGRGWRRLLSGRHDARARHAVALVRRIGSPAAVALLRETAASARDDIREEAQRALRDLERAA